MRTLRLHILPFALAFFLALLFAPTAFAGSGKAIIPPTETVYHSGTNCSVFHMQMSNITDNTIEVTITLYDKSGNFIYEHGTTGAGSGDIRIYDASTFTSEATSSSDGYTVKFELEAKKTCRLFYWTAYVASGNTDYMFGTITWRNKYSTDDDDVALVTTARRDRATTEAGRRSESSSNISINNSIPF